MIRWRGFLQAGCLATAGFGAWSSPALADDYLEVALGADYSTGDYGGGEDVEIVFLPASLKLKRDRWTLRASLPYVYIRGPGNVLPSDRGALPGGTPLPVVSNQGIGDLALTAEYTATLGRRTFVDLTGRMKVPTASVEKGLGTGLTSATAGAEVLQLFGPIIVAGRAGRRFNASSRLFRLRDVWETGGSVFYRRGDSYLGLSYDWRDNARSNAGDRSEVTGFVTHTLSAPLQLQAYGYVGLSDGSPDHGGGGSLLYRFAL